MISEISLNRMYESFISNVELTTKVLTSFGFTSQDLSILIEKGILKRTKIGYYALLSVDYLFNYGEKLVKERKYKEAAFCFKKCYELDPSHLGTCLRLFLIAIRHNNYEESFIYFEKIKNSKGLYYKDANYYLYLLSKITEIPSEEREHVKYLKLADIKVESSNKSEDAKENDIRALALHQKFLLAHKEQIILNKKYQKTSVQDEIIVILLLQAKLKQNEIKKHMVNLIKEKRYEEIISFLEQMQTTSLLSSSDNCVLFLAKEICELNRTRIIPKKDVFKNDRLFSLILSRNFDEALSISKKFILEKGIKPNDNTIYMLLEDIVDLINKIEFEKQEIATKKNELVPIVETIEDKVSYVTILSHLTKQDFDASFRTIKAYLKDLNKSEYEFLIVDLIKIDLLEKDMVFTKTMTALSYMSRKNFNFDVSNYVKSFYEKLSQNRFKEARLYLDIISNANKLGQSYDFINKLEQVLIKNESVLDSKNTISESSTSIKTNDSYQNKPNTNESVVVAREVITVEKEPINSDSIGLDEELIQNHLKELYDTGIVLFTPMDSIRRKNIHRIVDTIEGVESFSIGSGISRRVVLKLKRSNNEYVSFRELAKEGDIAFNSGKFVDSIELFRHVLEFGRPKAFIYGRLGLSYLKNKDKITAIKYLTVSTELSKVENKNFDYTELVGELQGLISPDDKKPKVKMESSEFYNDMKDYYGIKNIKVIIDYLRDGMSLDDVCLNLGLDEEQKLKVNLILARECFSQENYVLGDYYLKRVERTKNKSKLIRTLLDEIRRNKRLYKNRVKEGSTPLVMTLSLK